MTCHATGSRVTWTTTSNLHGRIVFVNTDPAWTVINQDTITGILLQNDPSSRTDNNVRSFVTELLVYATRSSQAINVTCSSDSGSSSHIIAPPSMPWCMFYIIYALTLILLFCTCNMQPILRRQSSKTSMYY